MNFIFFNQVCQLWNCFHKLQILQREVDLRHLRTLRYFFVWIFCPTNFCLFGIFCQNLLLNFVQMIQIYKERKHLYKQKTLNGIIYTVLSSFSCYLLYSTLRLMWWVSLEIVSLVCVEQSCCVEEINQKVYLNYSSVTPRWC